MSKAWSGRLTAITVLAGAILAIGPSLASGADPGRWDFVGRSSIPLEYFQGITSSPDGDLFFDGINTDIANNFQANADQDPQGDASDGDDDGDGVADATDNCQYRANPDQLDRRRRQGQRL